MSEHALGAAIREMFLEAFESIGLDPNSVEALRLMSACPAFSQAVKWSKTIRLNMLVCSHGHFLLDREGTMNEARAMAAVVRRYVPSVRERLVLEVPSQHEPVGQAGPDIGRPRSSPPQAGRGTSPPRPVEVRPALGVARSGDGRGGYDGWAGRLRVSAG